MAHCCMLPGAHCHPDVPDTGTKPGRACLENKLNNTKQGGEMKVLYPMFMPPTMSSIIMFAFNVFQKYLGNFGYLSDASTEAGPAGLTSKEEYVEALKRLQRMAHIPATGVVDTRTLELLKKPRCGNRDELPSLDRRRRRRYVTAPTKWKKNDLTYR